MLAEDRLSNVEQKLARVEATVEQHNKMFENQHGKNDTLTRLVTLMEYATEETKRREARQDERDKEQNKRMDMFGETLKGVNKSLCQISENQTQLKNEMLRINERVDEVESVQRTSEELNVIRLDGSFKKLILWGIGVVGSLITLYLAVKFGLK